MYLKNLVKKTNDFVDSNISIKDALNQMLREKIKYIVLLKEKIPLAILTERDIMFLYAKNYDFNKPALDIASKNLITSSPERNIEYILSLMIDNNIRRIIILNDNDEYMGVVSQEDVIFLLEADIYKSDLKIEQILQESNRAKHIDSSATLQNALDEMKKFNIGSLLIYENSVAIGIITETDLLKVAQKNIDTSSCIKDYMHAPIIYFDQNEYVFNMVKEFKEKKIRRAVVSDKNGDNFVLTTKDIMNNIKGNYGSFLESKVKDAKETFNRLNDAVIEVFDADANEQIIQWCNLKAKKDFNIKIGDDVSKIIGKNVWTILYNKQKENKKVESEIVELEEKTYNVTLFCSKILGNSVIKLIFSDISHLITDNKRLKQELSDSFEQPSIGIAKISVDGKILKVNNRFLSLFEYEEYEVLLHDMEEFIYKKDINIVKNNLSELLLHEEEIYKSFEKRIVTKNGLIKWINATIIKKYDKIEKINYFVFYFMDISEHVDIENKCINSTEKFKVLYENAPLPYQSLDENSAILEVNNKWLEMLGYTKEEVIGKKMSDFVDESEMLNLKEHFQSFKKNKEVKDFDLTLKHKNGKNIYVRLDGIISKVDDEFKTHCILQDVTEKRSLEEKINQALVVFDNTNEGIMVTDSLNNIVSINKSFLKITKYTLDEVIGKNPNILKSGKEDESFYKNMWESLLKKGYWSGEIFNRKKTGETYPEWLNISVIKDKRGKIINYIGIFSDISRIKESESMINYLSNNDSLTDLPNRFLLFVLLKRLIVDAYKSYSNLSILSINIDDLKLINDSYGHVVGDKVIQTVAQRLKKVVKHKDILARVSGDEFVLVLEHVGAERNILSILTRIIKKIKEDMIINNNTFNISVCIGVSIYPNNGLDAESLVKHAETALHSAKTLGSSRYEFYNESMTSEVLDKIRLEKEVIDGVINNEFEVYYQPQIDLASNKVIGAEALIRWNHKEKGILGPNEFLPYLESSNQIIILGETIINEVCYFFKELDDKNILKNGKIAVNLSGVQIVNSDIVDITRKAIYNSGLSPSCLEFEVVETFIMEDMESSIKLFNDLKMLGVQLAIDDFGTGYSSLYYIKNFPLDKLKIDKSFIDGIPNSKKDNAITNTIIALGQGLDLTVIAEGVENQDQEDYLKKHGCNEVQGWLHSKALQKEAFISFIKENNK